METDLSSCSKRWQQSDEQMKLRNLTGVLGTGENEENLRFCSDGCNQLRQD